MLKSWRLNPKIDLAKQIVYLLSLIILFATIGHWASILLSPSPLPIPAHSIDKEGNTVFQDAKNVFIGPSLLNANLSLKGVIVGSNHNGIAVISINNSSPRPFHEGHEISSGILLTKVTNNDVTIERQGHSETLQLHSQPNITDGISIEHR